MNNKKVDCAKYILQRKTAEKIFKEKEKMDKYNHQNKKDSNSQNKKNNDFQNKKNNDFQNKKDNNSQNKKDNNNFQNKRNQQENY